VGFLVKVTILSRGWLFLVVLAASLAGMSAEARETYRDFAQRLTTQGRADVRFRPDLEAYLRGAANSYRGSKGKSALGPNSAFLTAARAHAMDMALNDFVGHVSSNGRDFEGRIRAFRPDEFFLPSMGENAARVSSGEAVSTTKAAKLMQQWIKSTGHRKVLSSRNYTSVATGVVQKGNKLYAVQIFSGPDVKSNVRRTNSTGGGLY
jgi:uncharacterized protein YkwD